MSKSSEGTGDVWVCGILPAEAQWRLVHASRTGQSGSLERQIAVEAAIDWCYRTFPWCFRDEARGSGSQRLQDRAGLAHG